MRFKEIIETPYLDKVIKQVGQTIKTGSPMPANKQPKGPVKSSQAIAPMKQANKQVDRQMYKKGTTVSMPTGPNQEVDYKVDQVKGDEVTLSTNKVSNKSPQKITVTKKDLNPVIANTQRRQKATTQ